MKISFCQLTKKKQFNDGPDCSQSIMFFIDLNKSVENRESTSDVRHNVDMLKRKFRVFFRWIHSIWNQRIISWLDMDRDQWVKQEDGQFSVSKHTETSRDSSSFEWTYEIQIWSSIELQKLHHTVQWVSACCNTDHLSAWLLDTCLILKIIDRIVVTEFLEN